MPDDGNGDQKPKLAHFMPWFYTVVVILMVIYWALVNPDNVFGNGRNINLAWFQFQIYPGQATALQLLGTFIAAMGVMVSLVERRLTNYVPLALSIPAMFGAVVVMVGLVIQGIEENYLILFVLGLLLVCLIPIWIMVAALAGLKRAYSWLKSRTKSGD